MNDYFKRLVKAAAIPADAQVRRMAWENARLLEQIAVRAARRAQRATLQHVIFRALDLDDYAPSPEALLDCLQHIAAVMDLDDSAAVSGLAIDEQDVPKQ